MLKEEMISRRRRDGIQMVQKSWFPICCEQRLNLRSGHTERKVRTLVDAARVALASAEPISPSGESLCSESARDACTGCHKRSVERWAQKLEAASLDLSRYSIQWSHAKRGCCALVLLRTLAIVPHRSLPRFFGMGSCPKDIADRPDTSMELCNQAEHM